MTFLGIVTSPGITIVTLLDIVTSTGITIVTSTGVTIVTLYISNASLKHRGQQ